MKKTAPLLLVALLSLVIPVAAQPDVLNLGLGSGAQGNARWSTSVEPASKESDENLYEVVFEARINPDWYIYDLGPYPITALATYFDFGASKELELVGETYHIDTPKRKFDKMFDLDVGYFEGTARFGQKVRVTGPRALLAGEAEYQTCSTIENKCVHGVWEFSVPIGGRSERAGVAKNEGNSESPKGLGDIALNPNDSATSARSGQSSLWAMILEAILWGFAALLTPCVFPMVPMTVSFFMKGSENKALAGVRALTFGLFIVALYTLPIAVIILVTRFAGGETVTADIFNWLSTHWIPNVIFFLVFMAFAASLLGAFEMRMPSKLVNRSDRGAEKKGLAGVFFLALTLVLVSFSCTGPIVGTVLIKSTQGEFWTPIVTMLCFSVAFALPFTLLAFFPRLMNRLPKSGGWLNSVKVVLGLVEIALGLKFLSVADQTYHWGILDREVYLAIWIVVFALLGLYLLGKLRFKYDSPVDHIGVGRLALVIAVFSFVVYLVPGMWGAPLKAVSGYLPPISTQNFVAGSGSGRSEDPAIATDVKYSDILHMPHDLTGYFDFEQGMAVARAAGKPVFLDFTGHGCVNCREMEARVWVDDEVRRIMKEEYVIIALYSDDRTALPEADRLTTPAGKVLKTLGRKNSYIVNSRYGISAQPAYLLLDADGKMLVPVYGYNLDTSAFVEFLDSGVRAYNKK